MKPDIDITLKEWDIVRSLLQKHVPHHEVWVFGSRARRSAKPYSDLDLALLGPEPLPLETSAALADEFSESDLPWRVDVVDLARTDAAFRRLIDREKVVIQPAATNM